MLLPYARHAIITPLRHFHFIVAICYTYFLRYISLLLGLFSLSWFSLILLISFLISSLLPLFSLCFHFIDRHRFHAFFRFLASASLLIFRCLFLSTHFMISPTPSHLQALMFSLFAAGISLSLFDFHWFSPLRWFRRFSLSFDAFAMIRYFHFLLILLLHIADCLQLSRYAMILIALFISFSPLMPAFFLYFLFMPSISSLRIISLWLIDYYDAFDWCCRWWYFRHFLSRRFDYFAAD